MTTIMRSARVARAGALVLALALLGTSSVSMAQRGERDQFRGVWTGTFTPDMLFGVPEQHVERLSQPVQVELGIFTRGRVEITILSDNDEWIFTGRDLVLTDAGTNGVILGRLIGRADQSQNAFSLNITKVDDQTLLVEWSKISTRADMRFDGLDELAFAGRDELKLGGDDGGGGRRRR